MHHLLFTYKLWIVIFCPHYFSCVMLSLHPISNILISLLYLKLKSILFHQPRWQYLNISSTCDFKIGFGCWGFIYSDGKVQHCSSLEVCWDRLCPKAERKLAIKDAFLSYIFLVPFSVLHIPHSLISLFSIIWVCVTITDCTVLVNNILF